MLYVGYNLNKDNMKYIICFFIILNFYGCMTRTDVELAAIEDIANNYLIRKHLPNQDEFKLNSDSFIYKVYLSDGLLPISQIKKDNEWLFTDTFKTKRYDSIYHELINSEQFKKLNYREIDKSNISLKKPYHLIYSLKKELGTNEYYVKLIFSRVCFTNDFKYGLVYLDYVDGNENGSTGQVNVHLIQKENDRWVILFDKK